MKPERITEALCRLGESPIWCERASRLYWVDSRGPALHVLDHASGKHAAYPLPEVVGSICLREDGGLLAAMVTGIYALSPEGAIGRRIAEAVPNHPDNRFNDGRCDRAGRFIVGTMNDKARDPTGVLWSLGTDGRLTAMEGDVIVPNSLAFSPDDTVMYFADTYRHAIHRFDYDIETGRISNKRLFSDRTSGPGRPDGSAMDADGCLWNAEYAGGRVVRYTPDGKIDRVIELPVSQPSCCAFGGAQLDELYITTARQRLNEEQLKAQPLAGSLFVVRPGVKGLPEGRYRGNVNQLGAPA